LCRTCYQYLWTVNVCWSFWVRTWSFSWGWWAREKKEKLKETSAELPTKKFTLTTSVPQEHALPVVVVEISEPASDTEKKDDEDNQDHKEGVVDDKSGHSDDGSKKKHGHSHAKKKTNLNLQGVFLHLLGDALGAIGVIIVGICVMYIHPSWKYKLDPTLSILISLIIGKSSYGLVKNSIGILMQRVPESLDLALIENDLLEVPGVIAVHELHVWELTPTKNIGTLHITCNKNADFMAIVAQLKQVLHKHEIHATTIQPEFSESPGTGCVIECEKDCEAKLCCRPPPFDSKLQLMIKTE